MTDPRNDPKRIKAALARTLPKGYSPTKLTHVQTKRRAPPKSFLRRFIEWWTHG